MNILTNEQIQKLLANGSPENRDKNHPPVVRLHMLFTGCQWLLSELEPEHPHIAFGLCDLGIGFPEMGYVDLQELIEAAQHQKMFLMNDVFFEGKYPLTVYWKAALKSETITLDDILLQECYAEHLKGK